MLCSGQRILLPSTGQVLQLGRRNLPLATSLALQKKDEFCQQVQERAAVKLAQEQSLIAAEARLAWPAVGVLLCSDGTLGPAVWLRDGWFSIFGILWQRGGEGEEYCK